MRGNVLCQDASAGTSMPALGPRTVCPVLGIDQQQTDFLRPPADSDEAGHGFRFEPGHVFRPEVGQDSDLMSATLLP